MFIRDIPLGGKLALGRIDENDIVWIKVSEWNDFIAQTRVAHVCYDYREPLNPSRPRRARGNNYYPHSNINQWLNSDGTSELVQLHPFDSMPYRWNGNRGFMKAFNEKEFAMLQPMEVIGEIPMGSKKEFKSKTYSMTCKVRLPAMSELDPQSTDHTEGSLFDGALDAIRHAYPGYYGTIMTRTGGKDGGYIRTINALGASFDEPCTDIHAVHPVIRLDPDADVSDPDSDGVSYLDVFDIKSFVDLIFCPAVS